jgi:hypothetical protein
MIIFGGWNGHDTLNEVWSFSMARARWLKLETAGYISHRYRHSSVVFGNSMFVFGGVNKDQTRFADVHELNLSTNCW